MSDVGPTRSFTIVPVGDFSLTESALFGFGQRMDAGKAQYDGVMRLAFCLDDYSGQVGVELRQDDTGVHGVVHGSGDLEAIQRQVARVLSLDQDARSFADVGRRDPVIGALQAAAPGLRPPLFYSPYEATVWSVLSARRPGTQMATVRAALSEAHGATFDLAGQRLAALPTPSQLLAIEDFPGIDADRLSRMHGVAQAALDGLLDVDRLQGLDTETAMAEVQRIKGIGPFYATLIVIRATGRTDSLAANEPRLRALVRDLYQLPHDPTEAELETIAEPWRPWRTWTTVLIRAAGPRVLSGHSSS
ncbi:DNA-3-methyladenine glycosylase family protein [Kribbella monticola]|uniref:DNA-3-methyladenine glycosylase family protein n=1 Tax=Kribbella monticola TaxID=2185285 RepID=UPI000DD3C9EA|nr:DNA-3-methyladenine glycosylase [Kribbella monticola]